MQEIPIEGDFILELRKGSPSAFEELYREVLPDGGGHGNKVPGSPEDARDTFQEALFVFVKKLREPDFTLTSKASTFLYAIARNIYLKKAGKASPEISVWTSNCSILAKLTPTTEELGHEEKDSLLNLMNEKLGATRTGLPFRD